MIPNLEPLAIVEYLQRLPGTSEALHAAMLSLRQQVGCLACAGKLMQVMCALHAGCHFTRLDLMVRVLQSPTTHGDLHIVREMILATREGVFRNNMRGRIVRNLLADPHQASSGEFMISSKNSEGKLHYSMTGLNDMFDDQAWQWGNRCSHQPDVAEWLDAQIVDSGMDWVAANIAKALRRARSTAYRSTGRMLLAALSTPNLATLRVAVAQVLLAWSGNHDGDGAWVREILRNEFTNVVEDLPFPPGDRAEPSPNPDLVLRTWNARTSRMEFRFEMTAEADAIGHLLCFIFKIELSVALALIESAKVGHPCLNGEVEVDAAKNVWAALSETSVLQLKSVENHRFYARGWT